MRLPKMTEYAHYLITSILQVGDAAIDATCGNGHDTLFLAQKVGPNGQVYAFDIQEQAIHTTKERLLAAGVMDQVKVVHDSHSLMKNYVSKPVKVILFNLGYLPGGNKDITTTLDSSMVALQAGLELLQAGGLMVLVVYPGHPQGKIEREVIDPWTQQLDAREYQVVKINYYNQTDAAPYVLAIHRRSLR